MNMMHPQQNLIITLVPATYDDVLKLNQVEQMSQRGSDAKDDRGSGSGESRKGSKDGDRDERPVVKSSGRVCSLPGEITFDDDAEDEASTKDGSNLFRQSSLEVIIFIVKGCLSVAKLVVSLETF